MSKTVLITGSSRGIGRQTALIFARNGYNCIINGRTDSSELSTLRQSICDMGVKCLTFVGDMGIYENVSRLYDEAKKEFGGIDVIINNAGISFVGIFQDTDKATWDNIFRTNVDSMYNTCHHIVPDMISKKSGSIVNISSVWGLVGASCEVAYSATKGAINSFTSALAKELAPSNIRVNAIAFGAIDTDMNKCFTKEDMDALCEEIPTGRMGTADEAAALIYDIATNHSYLTGQIIKMDGGWI